MISVLQNKIIFVKKNLAGALLTHVKKPHICKWMTNTTVEMPVFRGVNKTELICIHPDFHKVESPLHGTNCQKADRAHYISRHASLSHVTCAVSKQSNVGFFLQTSRQFVCYFEPG